MWRSLASNGLTLLIVALVVLGGVIAWGQRQFVAPGPLAEGICLRVERGASVAAVSDALAAQGAIGYSAIFRLGADYTGKAGALKFGSYLVAPGASMAEILDIVTRGGQSTCGAEVNFRIGVASAETVLRELDPATGRYVEQASFPSDTTEVPQQYTAVRGRDDLRFRVTLAEGVTSWQVVAALRAAEFLSGEIGGVPAEGSLAPDSYEVRAGGERAALLAEMAARQVRILEDLWAARAEGLPYETPGEALVMASIVEKETGVADERALVASVFVNRLRAGMRLQTDPSVIYGVTRGQGVLGRGLRESELRSQTPWNTYVIGGLPPTPIANPGRDAIAAALDPAESDFLYFVADGSGGHAFAETLAEHNQNVTRWRQIEAERGRSE